MTGQEQIHNRFLALSRRRQFALVVATILVLFVFLETSIWGISLAIYQGTGKQPVPLRMIENFHPLWQPPLQKFVVESAYHPFLLWHPLPNIPYDPKLGHSFATDRHGINLDAGADPDRDLRLPGSRYRVFILGGSTVQGPNSTESLSLYVQNALDDSAPGRFEVIAAGWSGRTSWQELLTVQHQLIYLHPDMLITFDGINDANQGILLNNYTRNDHMRSHVLSALFSERLALGADAIEFDGISFLDFLKRFYSFVLFARVLDLVGVGIPDRYDANHEFIATVVYNSEDMKHRPEAVEAYLENLEMTFNVAQARDIDTIHVLQPTLSVEIMRRGEDVQPEELALMEIPHLIGEAAGAGEWAKYIDKFFTASRPYFLGKSNPSGPVDNHLWIDMSYFFSDVEDLTDVYYDSSHYRTPAARRIGKELAALVLQVAGPTGTSEP